MRRYVVLIALSGVMGCGQESTNIEQEKVEVWEQARSRMRDLVVPEIPLAQAVTYGASELRSPFAQPKPSYQVEPTVVLSDCRQPDPQRSRQPLEMYALDSLLMRGVIGKPGKLWALIDSGDGNLFRVTQGNYLGLDHGRIVSVQGSQIELQELVPDGNGCWQERMTTLALATD